MKKIKIGVHFNLRAGGFKPAAMLAQPLERLVMVAEDFRPTAKVAPNLKCTLKLSKVAFSDYLCYHR